MLSARTPSDAVTSYASMSAVLVVPLMLTSVIARLTVV